uniref:uncharacterized protein n=1 Tax=Pristiophorus japonicus TaxID=55135 RepID=UPI00398EE2E1
MISSAVYPCVIREFEPLPPLEAAGLTGHAFAVQGCALGNLNALRLRGSPAGGRYAGGLLIAGPPPRAVVSAAVGTWDQAVPRGGGPAYGCPDCLANPGGGAERPPQLDANCNSPAERCRSCRVSAAPEAPAPARSPSPVSTSSSSSPSSSSTSSSSSSSSPLSCFDPGSGGSPNPVCRDGSSDPRPAAARSPRRRLPARR